MNVTREFLTPKTIIHFVLDGTLKYCTRVTKCCFKLLQLLRSFFISAGDTTANRTNPAC